MGSMTFYLLGVDYVKFSPPYDRVWKWYVVRDVLVFAQSKYGGCAKVPVD